MDSAELKSQRLVGGYRGDKLSCWISIWKAKNFVSSAQQLTGDLFQMIVHVNAAPLFDGQLYLPFTYSNTESLNS